jgi:hypothetical protein
MKNSPARAKLYIATLTIAAFFLFVPKYVAQVMSGSSYQIESDSINIGGADSSSTNYQLSDTVGEVGTGYSDGTSYGMHAGYQQLKTDFYLSLSTPSDLALSSISGFTGGNSEGTVTWQVTTDNPAGYTLSVSANTSPALTSSTSSFADYTPSGSDPDYNFSIANTDSEFGFTPEGTDVTSTYKDNGSACNTGSGETQGKCWTNFSTTPKTIMQRGSSNHASGSSATVRVRAEAGSNHFQPSGSYQAQLTVTAITL